MITCICHVTRPPCHYCESSAAICDLCEELIYFQEYDDYQTAMNESTHYHSGDEEEACVALANRRYRKYITEKAYERLRGEEQE